MNWKQRIKQEMEKHFTGTSNGIGRIKSLQILDEISEMEKRNA